MRSATCLAVCLLLIGSVASAIPFTATHSDVKEGRIREAEAVFEVVGTDLVITLTNTRQGDALKQIELLSGIFWDLDGNPALTADSAVLATGSGVWIGTSTTVSPGPVDPGGVVGGEFSYNGAIVHPTLGTYGVNANGVGGFFGDTNRFPGNDLDPPTSPNGRNYGLTTATDDLTTSQATQLFGVPIIQNSVVFTLGGIPTGFDPSRDISNVVFQYGTSLDETTTQIPEPGTLALLGLGLGAVALVARRRRRV